MAASSTSWKPGQAPKSPGPGKGPRMPLEVRRLKDEAKSEVIKAISNGLLMDMGRLQEIVSKAQPRINGQINPHYDAGLPVVDVLVASVIGNCIKHGDMARLSLLINYVLGKPKQLGSSWHDDAPDDGPESVEGQRRAISQVPSSMLIQMLKSAGGTTPGEG